MVIAYVPTSFWATVLARTGSALPYAMPTTFLLVCISIAAAARRAFDSLPLVSDTTELDNVLRKNRTAFLSGVASAGRF